MLWYACTSGNGSFNRALYPLISSLPQVYKIGNTVIRPFCPLLSQGIPRYNAFSDCLFVSDLDLFTDFDYVLSISVSDPASFTDF